MAQVLVNEQTLTDIATAIREKGKTTSKYKPGEMAQAIRDIPEMTKSFILEMEDGTEIPAVLTEQEVVFDATPNDIREGKVAASGDGVVLGEKVIPSYHTTEMYRYIPVGSEFVIPLPDLDKYDYTKLQVIICKFNSTLDDSVFSEKIALQDRVYDVASEKELSIVKKDATRKAIDLGITNESDHPCVIRVFTYKEIK